MEVKNLSFFLLILFSIFTITTCAGNEPECIYNVYVQTGSIKRAGTHSWGPRANGLNESGVHVVVPNLEDWGIMGPGYNYFETGYLDMFAGKGPCLDGPVCGLNLTSDGSGPYHGWYCDYVEVSVVGAQKPCSKQHFTVEQWLATDTETYKLTADRNVCSSIGSKDV